MKSKLFIVLMTVTIWAAVLTVWFKAPAVVAHEGLTTYDVKRIVSDCRVHAPMFGDWTGPLSTGTIFC